MINRRLAIKQVNASNAIEVHRPCVATAFTSGDSPSSSAFEGGDGVVRRISFSKKNVFQNKRLTSKGL
jgi:hypothetical protein